MSEITYCPATASNAAAIAEVIAEVVSGPNPVGFDEPWGADRVSAWIERLGSAGALFIAEEDGTILGFGTLDFNTQDPETATLGVWLLTQHRRRGIGTTLARYLLEHARDSGFMRLVGRLPENNEPALSFLSSIGGLVPIMNPDMRYELPL